MDALWSMLGLNQSLARSKNMYGPTYDKGYVGAEHQKQSNEQVLFNSTDVISELDRLKYVEPCPHRQQRQRRLKIASIATDD